MTLLVLLLLDGGIILIVSGIQGVPILATIHQIWTDQLSFAPATTGNAGSPGGHVPTYQSYPVSPTTTGAPAGVQPLSTSSAGLGMAIGPAPYGQQYDAYRAAVVRAYLQSQR